MAVCGSVAANSSTCPPRFADSTLHRLDTARLGAGHGAAWIRPYKASGLTGLPLAHTRKEAAAEIPHPPERVKAAGSWTWRNLHPTNR